MDCLAGEPLKDRQRSDGGYRVHRMEEERHRRFGVANSWGGHNQFNFEKAGSRETTSDRDVQSDNAIVTYCRLGRGSAVCKKRYQGLWGSIGGKIATIRTVLAFEIVHPLLNPAVEHADDLGVSRYRFLGMIDFNVDRASSAILSIAPTSQPRVYPCVNR